MKYKKGTLTVRGTPAMDAGDFQYLTKTNPRRAQPPCHSLPLVVALLSVGSLPLVVALLSVGSERSEGSDRLHCVVIFSGIVKKIADSAKNKYIWTTNTGRNVNWQERRNTQA